MGSYVVEVHGLVRAMETTDADVHDRRNKGRAVVRRHGELVGVQRQCRVIKWNSDVRSQSRYAEHGGPPGTRKVWGRARGAPL
jgi:hypothetical protein